MAIDRKERIVRKSNFAALRQKAEERQASHPDGIAVLTLIPLENRTDGSQIIFSEGEKFSGIEQEGNAVTCLTIPASPHVIPSIPKSRFLAEASGIFGREAALPNLTIDSDLLAPQLVAWWNKSDTTANGKCDILNIFSLPKEEQDNFFRAISKQVTRATLVIQQFSGQPTIWGSWGYASMEERMKYGKSRGCPTNKFGHCHIAFFDGEAQPTEISTQLSQNDQLNHYSPWNLLLMERFGRPITTMTQNIINNSFNGENTCGVNVLHSLNRFKNGAIPIEEGISVVFKKEIALGEAFRIITLLAGNFEAFYQNLSSFYEKCHKQQYGGGLQTETAMVAYLKSLGITDEAQGLTNFALKIRPTYEQLLKWESELTTEDRAEDVNAEAIRTLRLRYDKIRPRFERAGTNQLTAVDLLRDTCRYPNPHQANEFTWPVHSSACYAIDDYVTEGDRIFVRGIKLFPAICSTESVPQIKLGAVLRRAIQ